jgi:acyl-[acyl-carrier-protein]-phospholipid O-acyltransferase / long-chain-fatty-acid--[acyl-carrier-protein] ligase
VNDETHELRGWRRGFWSLWVTQFQGAFSDNVHKMLITFLILALAMPTNEKDWLILWIGVLFALPFVLFSMTGGWLANRFSKRSVTIGVKVLEIAVMTLATVGLALVNLPLLLVCVFLMSLQSALFGPSKYGLLPELLAEEKLSWGNGVLAMGTNVAILLGTVTAGFLADAFAGRQFWSGAILVGLACVGTATSLGINRVPAADPSAQPRINFLGDLFDQIAYMRRDRVLTLALIGNAYFSFLGSLLIINVTMYGDEILHLSFRDNSLLQTAIAIGVGVGAVAAGYLSGRKIEYGLVPLGSIGLTMLCALLAVHGLSMRDVVVRLALAGFFGGFFVVPISAILQHRPESNRLGGVLGANNLLSFVGVMVGFAVNFALRKAGLTPTHIFMAGAVMTLAGTMYVVWLLPDSLLRLLLWMLTHSIYRIKVLGRDNIPERGGALFVCNHVSFVDALLVQAATDRPLRCIMFKDIYEHPVVKPFAKIARHIPISSQQRPREMIQSLRIASDAIKNDEVVVIFAEGQITRIGQLLPFRRGFERIMKNVDAPIIPICLDNVWGSIFSFEKGRFLWKVPRYFPYPVTVSFGKPMPSTATPFEVRQAVQELDTEAWRNRRSKMLLLHRAFIRKARHHPTRFFMADGHTKRLNFGSALTRTIFLARRLRSVWKDQEMVGILLPPSVGGALVNYAALLMGKVPVNLNYTVNNEVLVSCAEQCKLKSVVTSQAFLDKVKLIVPGQRVLLEGLIDRPSFAEKLIALLLTWTLPRPLLERALGRERDVTLDDVATVIFSSGSTGEPKGVMLTHYNVASNIEQMGQTFAFGGRDRILGILPFFHSFGFTGTLMTPAVLGVGVVYHVSPLDAKAIGALVRKYRVTFLLATPTFLQLYHRSCEPEDFGSLQFVMTAAEKLPDRVAQAFEDKFGIRPLEGYGATECSPAVAVNTHDFRAAGFRQVGAKRGKIGHPLPGVSVRIVDPDTMQSLPVGQPGLLLVRGPNVMKGYLGRPEKTAEVLKDGWYVTGDIAALDADGFLQITDRLSRFSKIGGEMIPHIKVEETLHELADVTEQCFAVTGVPDEKKGERLVVLHTLSDDKLKPVLDNFAASDLPNLWKPRLDQFFHVDALPYLGTGKLDLRKVRETATAFAGANQHS